MKKRRADVITACILAALTFLAVYFQWFSALNLVLWDFAYQRENRADPAIRIIAIDEKSLDQMGPFDTWTRDVYADLITRLNESGYEPRVIALDVLLVGEKGAGDSALLEACEACSNVVMASNLVFSTKLESEGGTYRANSMYIDMVEMPYGTLPETVKTGFANTVLDSGDNAVRYALLECGGYSSFALEIARMAQGTEAGSIMENVQTDENGGILIDYTGASGAYETLSFCDVLDGKIPAEVFRDSIVLVGAYAAGMGDSYAVPVQKGSQMYGVEINANIVQGLLEGRSLKMADLLWNGICCGLLVFLMVLLMARLRVGVLILAAAVVTAAQFLLCLWLDDRMLVIDMATLPIFLLVALVWSIVYKYAAETLQKKKIVKAFQKYVAPQVVEEIAKKHDYQLKLGGERRHVAVLFVDIRGFTSLSEALAPEQVVEILNEYLSLVTDAILKNGGMLDKFIGDAAMAVFNAPFDSEDYIYRAVCAAWDIAAGSERIAAKFMERFGKKVSYGIGVNCGDAVVGNIGSDFRMDYTAIGDTVNTAARLEANAKAGQILISDSVYESLKGRISATEIGKIPLKGKSRERMVYALDWIEGRKAGAESGAKSAQNSEESVQNSEESAQNSAKSVQNSTESV